jgi:hypothetical protein
MNLDSWVAYSIYGTGVVVPHWFKYGPGSALSFLSQCGSGFMEPDQCESGSWSDLKFIDSSVQFLHENILKVGINRSKNIPTRVKQ